MAAVSGIVWPPVVPVAAAETAGSLAVVRSRLTCLQAGASQLSSQMRAAASAGPDPDAYARAAYASSAVLALNQASSAAGLASDPSAPGGDAPGAVLPPAVRVPGARSSRALRRRARSLAQRAAQLAAIVPEPDGAGREPVRACLIAGARQLALAAGASAPDTRLAHAATGPQRTTADGGHQ